jgi:hypothetical protein
LIKQFEDIFPLRVRYTDTIVGDLDAPEAWKSDDADHYSLTAAFRLVCVFDCIGNHPGSFEYFVGKSFGSNLTPRHSAQAGTTVMFLPNLRESSFRPERSLHNPN